jgi:hypothetical protein
MTRPILPTPRPGGGRACTSWNRLTRRRHVIDPRAGYTFRVSAEGRRSDAPSILAHHTADGGTWPASVGRVAEYCDMAKRPSHALIRSACGVSNEGRGRSAGTPLIGGQVGRGEAGECSGDHAS